MRLVVLAMAGCIAAGVAGAQPQPVEPVGVPACDVFLRAYEQCAASDGVPAVARTSLLNGIKEMREIFAGTLARRGGGAVVAKAQCLQIHDATRQSLVDAFKCDFPVSETGQAGTVPSSRRATATSTEAPRLPNPEAQADAKARAYTEAQNYLAEWHNIEKKLAEYQSSNERVLRLGTKLGANAWYSFGISDFDNLIERLEKAVALPGAVREVDTSATKLLETMRTVNPTIKALDRYQTTREFKEDDYKFAREQHPQFVTRMKATATAAGAYGDALFDRGMARDETRVASLAEGSLPRQMLGTSLAVRRAVKRYEALQPRGDPAAFSAALQEVSSSNRALGMALDGLSPKADTDCTSYNKTLDSLLGQGRDIARDVRSGGNWTQAAEGFARYYNRSVDEFGRCMKDEARARS